MRMPMTAGRSAVAAGDAGATASSADGRAMIRPGGWRLGAAARRHWLISVLLLAGLVLRVLAEIAYRPALLYIDSLKYLYGAWPGNDPMGYNVVLKGLLLAGNLASVAAIQHLLGLAMGLTLYLVLGRRGVPRWLAALAAAPVLLDGYQLQIEQTIMPDVWFEACIVAGLALLLWRPRPGPRLIVAGGLVLGLSAPFAQVGQILILPALLFVLIVVSGWRRKLILGAALCVAFAIPIAGFSMREKIVNGHFSLAPAAGNTIYGRLAESADCATLKLPSYEKALCPPRALAVRLGPDGLVHNGASPDKTYVAPPGRTHAQMTDDFEHQVLVQQPLRVVAGILADSVKLFALGRHTSTGDTPISRWQFQTSYPTYGDSIFLSQGGTIKVGLHYAASGGPTVVQTLTPSWGGPAQVVRPLASFLRGYQLDGGYTPGPLLALCAVFGLLGSLAVLRRRGRAADWTEERRERGTSDRATREGDKRRGNGEAGGAPGGAEQAEPVRLGRAAAARAGLPAGVRRGGGRAAGLGRVRVLLALSAARAGHPAARGCARHRPGHRGAAPEEPGGRPAGGGSGGPADAGRGSGRPAGGRPAAGPAGRGPAAPEVSPAQSAQPRPCPQPRPGPAQALPEPRALPGPGPAQPRPTRPACGRTGRGVHRTDLWTRLWTSRWILNQRRG